MSTKDLRFGLVASSEPSRRDWLDKAKKAEDLGYDVLLTGDHTFDWFSPFLALQAAADVTSRLRFGTYTLGNDFRNPIMLARDALALDILSDGRFELGLGTGWYINDYKHTGIPLDSPGERVSRLQEAVQILKSAFRGETVSFQGNYYTVQDYKLPVQPVQRLPLLLGGGGKRMLSFAAQEADIVGLNILSTPAGWLDMATISEQAVARKVDWVKQAAGERADFELSIFFILTKIVDSQEEQERAADELCASWGIEDNTLSLKDVLASPYVLIGSEEAIVEKVQRLREIFGLSYFVFWEPIEMGARLIKHLKSG